jgi:hypothetical protein
MAERLRDGIRLGLLIQPSKKWDPEFDPGILPTLDTYAQSFLAREVLPGFTLILDDLLK